VVVQFECFLARHHHGVFRFLVCYRIPGSFVGTAGGNLMYDIVNVNGGDVSMMNSRNEK
jgi:hypothetical protein